MIVSHEHKLIFLKSRKVAGTSFEIALSKYLNDNDIITPVSRDDEAIRRKLGFLGPRNYNYDFVKYFTAKPDKPVTLLGLKVPFKFYNHIPASVAKRRLGSSIWRDYKKISIVRNPWDRAVSIFYWKNSKRWRTLDLAKFTEFFKENKAYLESNYANYMIGGRDVIDFYIRYENFAEDILRLEQEIPSLSGLQQVFSSIHAKGGTREKTHTNQELFDANPEVNTMIGKLNAWEIRKFGYHL